MALGNPVTPTDPTRDTTIFNINYAMLFTYNSTRVSGGCWICYRGYDANTNTIGYQVRTNNSTLKASDKFYRYRLLFTSADGTQWVPANTSTSTNATSARNVNQRPIDPFGEITWYGTTTVIEANANVTAAQLWQQYYDTYTLIGYSFNNTGAAATMTANRPIYIKCTPQSNGSAIIDANTPYVQALPSTDDGKIYIFLGRAVSATAFEILLNHPVYYHKDGAIRIWTNPADSGMANPMTALGDMIYGDAGADPIKLSIGTSGQVLTSDGSIPYWATPATPATVGTLDTTATTAQTTSASESFSNNITLHKVSKTGSYNDLNDKPTIPVDTNTTYTLNVSGTGDNANKVGLVAGGSGSGTVWYTIPYATSANTANSATTAGSATTASTADVANSVAWANVSGHADGVKTDIGISSSGSTYLKKDGTWDTPTDTNTTYALSGALASHKFTSTLTAGGSGSGTSTSDLTLEAGSNITLTDDTSNRKITIAATDTNTTYSLTVSGTGDNANKLGLTAGGSGSGTTWVTIPYATTSGSANSVSWSNISGHAAGVKADIGMTTLGDIIHGDAGGNPMRLGIGTAGQVLISDGYVPAWGSVTTSGISSGTASSGKVLTADGSGGASWTTPNAGTVTSVQVQAGTGLTSSQSTAQTSTLNTTIGIDSGYKLPTTTEWSKVVLTDTDQSIDGTKTFVERPLYPNTVTLPSGYTQLEYIHSDGTAYINTGRKYSTDDSVELIFQQDDTANYRIWGTFNQSSYAGKNVSMTYSVGWCVRQETRDGQQALIALGTIDTKKHTLKILPSGHCYFDGVDYGKSEGWAANFTFSYNAYLFTINPGGTAPTATMKGRVYRYRVWRSGALVQDMYPVKYVSGGTTTYGMYDVINNQYYTNANSSGTLTGAGTPTPTPMVFEDDLSQVAFSGDYNDLNNLPTIPTNYVTTNTAQTVSATKTFTAQQKFQSGSPSGCVVFGANVSATTVSAGTRKLARLTVPTYETNGSSVVGFVSIDNNAYSNGGGNAVEFGSRNGDSTSFGPDLIAFSVATSHNVTTRNNIAQFLPSKVQLFNHASGQTSIQQTPATNLIGMWEFNNNNTFVNNAYTYTLPNTTGTIALTSNIPSVPVTDVQINGTSILSSGVANILTNTAYNSSTNKIATMSDVPNVPSWALESTKPSYSLSEISGTDDLQAIEGLTGTSGLLKKTAANTWALDTSSYLVNPITALGDLIYGNADGSAGTRLAIGTSGKVLTSDGNAPIWGSVTTSGISSGSATSGYVLTADGSGGVSWAAGGGSGTVTSVGGTGSGGISVTGGPITSSGTLTVGIDSGYKLPTTTEWGKVVTATQNNNVTVPGTGAPGGSGATTVVTTYTYDKTRIYTPNGIIIGGTAAKSGLVTRGICGVNTPTSGGACTKDNLFLNYDGDNTYRAARQVVLQAGATGTHYGSNVYQYCAVRGDALKGWIEGKFPNTTTANKVLLSTTTSGTTAWSNWSTAGLLKTDTSGVVSVDSSAYIANPMTTKGDIIVGGDSGAPTRLAGPGTTKFLQGTGSSSGISISWEDIQGAYIKSGTTGNYATSGQVLTADGSGSASWSNVSVTGTVPLSQGGTGIDAGSVQTWYTSTTLHPHFQVTFANNQWTCVYLGPTEGITDIASALDSQYVKYALSQVVPVVSGTILVFNGVIVSNALGLHAEQIDILFPDMIAYGGALVNGISGTLTWSSADGLYLSNIAIHTPGAVTYASSIVSAATGLGTPAIGSSTQPVYWTGSAFAATTNSLPSVTSADAGKILTVDSNGNWVAATMAQWTGGNY